MMKTLFRKCPICNSIQGKVLGSIKMVLGDNMKLPSQYDIVACCQCGFTFADTSSKQEDYNDYYASDNCYADEGEVKSMAQRQSIESIVNFLERHVDKSQSVLDIGCGAGNVLLELQKRGFRSLMGVDPSPASIELISKKGIDGVVGNIFDEPREEHIGKFDVVISTCVMEHICDLNGFMENAKQYLCKDGRMYIVVPAVEGFEKYYQRKPNYFNHEHINYFSKKSLSNLMGKHCMVSQTEDAGEYYEVIPPNGVADVLLHNIFVHTPDCEHILEIDNISSKSIENYLEKDRSEARRLYDIIDDVKKSSQKCIVWGAGSLSMQMMSDGEFADVVMFMVDNNKEKWGKDIAGISINSPEILHESQYGEIPIVVMCMQYSTTVVKQIQDMGLRNKIIVY